MNKLTENAGCSQEAHCALRQDAIEGVLRAHPGAREVAVIDDGREGLVAYVVPDDRYADAVLGFGMAGVNIIGRWRKVFDLSQLGKKAASVPAGFNTEGWNSSYTRGPIPSDQMREWVDHTVGDILRLEPKEICEIGCGAGLLVLRIAPRCDRYMAVDFSPIVLERLREQLCAVPEAAARVETLERKADDLGSFRDDEFDTVVLSSVAQFFPGIPYLSKVLENAIRMVRPGGHIYVGDLRSLPLWPAFATSVELFQAGDGVSAGELRERIRRRMEREPELLISPAFFLALPHCLPKISRVEIRPLRGFADNEMTRFRYAAILHVGAKAGSPLDAEFQNWTECRWSLEEIRSRLRQNPGERLGLQRIRNARIEKDIAAMVALQGADETPAAGELRCRLDTGPSEGIHPQALLDLQAEGFSVFLSWAACRPDGSYDALLLPHGRTQEAAQPAIGWPEPEDSAFMNLANAPGQAKLQNELIAQLAAHCRQCLPEEMQPGKIILVDMLPLTANGAITRGK